MKVLSKSFLFILMSFTSLTWIISSCNFHPKKSVFFFDLVENPATSTPLNPDEPSLPSTAESNPTLIFSTTNLVLTEGSSTSYTIHLSSAVTETLTVNFTCSQTYITCPSAISFDSSNWNTPQIIILSIAHDVSVTGIRTMTISHSFVYKTQTQSSDTLNLTILDIDSANIQFSPSSPSPQIKEGTVTDFYTVVLTSAPSSNVSITITYDSSKLMSINGDSSGTYSLTFTPINYNTPQTLTFSAPFDTGLGNRNVTLSHNVTSSDLNYNGFTLSNVTVQIEGNSGGSVGWGSFQSGTQAAGFTSTSITLATAVNPSKAYVYCNFEYSSSSPSAAATCQLNGTGTQVIIQTGGNPNAKVNWYVVEMETGLKVERGNTTFTTGESTKVQTLSNSFYTQSSFVILYTRTNNTDHTNDAERLVMGSLTSSTSLELKRLKSNTAGMNVVVEWQVVELAGAKVLSGTTSINNAQTTKLVTLSESLNLSKSFLIFNTTAHQLTGGEEQNYYIRGNFNAANSLTFARDGSTGKVDISYFAIEMVDSSAVQSGSGVTVGATTTSVNVSLSPAVVVSRSMIVMSYSTSGSSVSFQDSGTFSAVFASSPTASQVNFNRFNHESHPCTLNWFVIEFPP